MKDLLRYFHFNWLAFIVSLAFYASSGGTLVHLILAAIQLPWMAVSLYRMARA